MKKLLGIIFVSAMLSLSGTSLKSDPYENRLLDPEINPLSDSVILVKLPNMVLKKPTKELKVGDIFVSSPTDADFAGGINPEYFGYWTKPVRYSIRKPLNVKHTDIFVFLPKPMKAGNEYSVGIRDAEFEKISVETGGRDKSGKTKAPALSFKYPGDSSVSEVIHVSHAGYLPDSAKFAYLSQYAGWKNAEDNKPLDMDFTEYKKFNLVASANGSVDRKSVV